MLEINAYLDELSSYIKERIAPTMAEYGIELSNFYVNDISVPEDDTTVIKLKETLSKRADMDILGYTYTQERSFDTLEGAAKNPGSPQSAIMGAGIGLGMGTGMGVTIGGQVSKISQHLDTRELKKCPKCSVNVDASSRYCPACGIDTIGDNQANDTKSSNPVCNKCGHELDKTVKFCPECGDSYNPCVSCGADLDLGVTQCPFCGEKTSNPCPECGTIPAVVDAKFCVECGKSLVRSCEKCGYALSGNPKFCPECGSKT